MNRTTARRVLGTALLGVGAALLVKRAQFEKVVSQSVEDLRRGVRPHREGCYSRDDLGGLPVPVQRYFEHVLPEGQPDITSAQIRQKGAFNFGDTAGSWKPLAATQHVSTDPPGFVWDATIELFPFVSARVLDAYREGDGTLQAKVLSAVSVAAAGPSPEMNQGELLRYLAEAVWFPTALLPRAGVEWDAIDDQSARATFEDAGNSASLVFYFNDENEVERVHADRRYRQEARSYQPWTGYFDEYRVEAGMRIPGTAEVEWNAPDGDEPYWRAHLEEVEYAVADGSD